MTIAVGSRLCWSCRECGGPNWTIVRDEGIVMQRIACRREFCGGIAHYNEALTNRIKWTILQPTPEHEWYRASRAEARRVDKQYPGTFEYHKAGGLFLRKISNDENEN